MRTAAAEEGWTRAVTLKGPHNKTPCSRERMHRLNTDAAGEHVYERCKNSDTKGNAFILFQ